MNEFSQYGESSDKDVSNQHSDPSSISGQYSDLPESSTMSDARIGKAGSYTESEIMLAASHPKKPTGRKKFKETRHPVYRGVRRRNSNRWVCEVREPNKKNRIWLGTYPTAEMAARAHDVAALALRGMGCCLNFADSACRLPVPASNDQEDIQRAAAEAAEMFRPEEYDEENLNKDKMIITIDEEASSGSNKNVTNYQASSEDSTRNNISWQIQPQPQLESSYYAINERDQQTRQGSSYYAPNETEWQTQPPQESSYYATNETDWQTQPQQETSHYSSNETNWQTQPQPHQESSYYFDEEAIFDMPGFLNSMAEGLLLPPPTYLDDGANRENAENADNAANNEADMTLWNHRF